MVNLNIEEIMPDIEHLIEDGNSGALLNILMDMHPADIEEILNRLKKEQRLYLFNLLPTELASEVLSELDTPVVDQILEEKTEEEISSLVDQMDSDDAADVISELPEDKAARVLDKMTEEEAEDVKQLLHHEEDTAGGIMAVEFLAMPENATVNQTIEKIREMRDEIDELYNVWVVDEHGHLIGSVSLTDLVLAHGNTKLKQIMDEDLHFVRVDMDQEEVANYFRKYDLVSVPVVDEHMKLVGRITVDDVVDVMEEEGAEDLAYMAGAPDEEIMEESTFVLSKARIPWLLVAFFGEIVSAFILNSFEATLQQKVISAFFIPIVMAMGGSTGQQASVIVVRGLATGDIGLGDTKRRLFKEFRISLFTSIFFSALLFGVVYFWDGLLFASILAFSMFVVINNAAIVGALIPLTFKRFNIDPALAAAPFISTSNDIIGLLIYLSITTFALRMF
ncbi:MAG TPA: magnesium transporter [Caldithrix abyssi]|uniref:Magnesium transporter MgtE n=1 Tax=Caldithrix abyssi TaxID=187145 RepID=A0A7V5UE39_CALAY|nr:magnesium transporter [Caldithrix abyssi]